MLLLVLLPALLLMLLLRSLLLLLATRTNALSCEASVSHAVCSCRSAPEAHGLHQELESHTLILTFSVGF
jgi:hypothetical protein